MHKCESYWTYRAPDTPEFSDLPEGVFSGTEQGWNSLSPGYRRTIWREATKTLEPQKQGQTADDERLNRADQLHRQGEVQIAAREAL